MNSFYLLFGCVLFQFVVIWPFWIWVITRISGYPLTFKEVFRLKEQNLIPLMRAKKIADQAGLKEVSWEELKKNKVFGIHLPEAVKVLKQAAIRNVPLSLEKVLTMMFAGRDCEAIIKAASEPYSFQKSLKILREGNRSLEIEGTLMADIERWVFKENPEQVIEELLNDITQQILLYPDEDGKEVAEKVRKNIVQIYRDRARKTTFYDLIYLNIELE